MKTGEAPPGAQNAASFHTISTADEFPADTQKIFNSYLFFS